MTCHWCGEELSEGSMQLNKRLNQWLCNDCRIKRMNQMKDTEAWNN